MSELLTQICAGKRRSNDNLNRYIFTPHYNNDGWHNPVSEPQELGFFIKALGDTRDKIVLHPGHLGYDFNYHWGRDPTDLYTEEQCWDNKVNTNIKMKGDMELTEIGIEIINLGYEVWVAQVKASCQGRLRTKVSPFEEEIGNTYERVLFVFDFDVSDYT